MKFDYVIGNPPYQEENKNNGRQNPVYNLFMDEAYKIADCVEMIHPARFLFNAGQTPKRWNRERLNDEHFKVLEYEANASQVFPTTEIKGGIAITIRNKTKKYNPIGIFTAYKELNGIAKKVKNLHEGKNLDSVISSRGCYRTTEAFFSDFPYAAERLGAGTGNMIASNFFEKIPEAYALNVTDRSEYYGILSRIRNERTICYIKRQYVQFNEFISGYNVACPKSNGTGEFGGGYH